MNYKINFLIIAGFIAGIIALFQSILLLYFFLNNKKGNKKTNILLSSVLFLFIIQIICSLYMCYNVIFYIFDISNKIFFFILQFAFLTAPMIYFYFKTIFNPSYKFKLFDLFHFIPFISGVIYSLIIIKTYKLIIFWHYPHNLIVNASIIIQNFIYFIFYIYLFKINGIKFKQFFKYFAHYENISWIRLIITSYFSLWFIQLFYFIGWDILRTPKWYYYAYIFYLFATFIFLNLIVYFKLKFPESDMNVKKYKQSILKDETKELYKKKILSIMEDDKIYLEASVNLIDISKKLNIAPCYVSQIINEAFKMNFTDFLNKFRIEESKNLLIKYNGKRNILDIAYDSGFNSKSTFNSAFKKFCNITPKEYQTKFNIL